MLTASAVILSDSSNRNPQYSLNRNPHSIQRLAVCAMLCACMCEPSVRPQYPASRSTYHVMCLYVLHQCGAHVMCLYVLLSVRSLVCAVMIVRPSLRGSESRRSRVGRDCGRGTECGCLQSRRPLTESARGGEAVDAAAGAAGLRVEARR